MADTAAESLRPPPIGRARSRSPTPGLSLKLAIPSAGAAAGVGADGGDTLQPETPKALNSAGLRKLNNVIDEIAKSLPPSRAAPNAPDFASMTSPAGGLSPFPPVPPPESAPPSAETTPQKAAAAYRFSDDVLENLYSLGEGASGAVHAVRDTRTQAIMARKTIVTRDAPMKQLLRELGTVSSLAHPNIIRFYGAYISPSSSEVKLLMELGEGKSLEALCRFFRNNDATISEPVTGRLADGVLQGLAYLHSKKMIHRDIKPANILLSRKGVVKLCDFGVAGELIDSHAATFTGTSFYMAPERLNSLPYTIRSDVWSTGVTFLELVTNQYPWPTHLNAIELIQTITSDAPPTLEGDWSDDMKDFIAKMLMQSGTDRPTPEDMLAHQWVSGIMSGPKVNMSAWMRQVWGWPEPAKK